MSERRYTFDTRTNSYYLGRDLQVRDATTGAIVILNIREDCWAVNVKDNVGRLRWPADAKLAAYRLGERETQRLYDEQVEEFWRWAETEAEERGFPRGIISAGRSAGWLVVPETKDLTGEFMIEPHEDEAGEADLRDRFLSYAFAVQQAIEDDGGFRAGFYDVLRAAGVALPDGVEQYTVSVPPTAVAAKSPSEAVALVLDDVVGEAGMTIVLDKEGERIDFEYPERRDPVTVTLSRDAFVGLCGLVQPTDEVDAALIQLQDGAWKELRRIFPLSIYETEGSEA